MSPRVVNDNILMNIFKLHFQWFSYFHLIDLTLSSKLHNSHCLEVISILRTLILCINEAMLTLVLMEWSSRAFWFIRSSTQHLAWPWSAKLGISTIQLEPIAFFSIVAEIIPLCRIVLQYWNCKHSSEKQTNNLSCAILRKTILKKFDWYLFLF